MVRLFDIEILFYVYCILTSFEINILDHAIIMHAVGRFWCTSLESVIRTVCLDV